MPPVRLHQLSRIIYGSYPCILCEEPEEPTAVAAVTALKRVTQQHDGSSFPWTGYSVRSIDDFEARFATPDALEGFVAGKLADYKRKEDISRIVDYLRDMSKVIAERPEFAKYVDLAKLQKMITDFAGPMVTLTSQEKIDVMGYADPSAAKEILDRFGGDLFEAVGYGIDD